MKLIIILTSVIFLSACGQNSGSSGSSTPAVGDSTGGGGAQVKSCTGFFQRAWLNTTTGFTYELASNCTGRILSCEAEFDYSIPSSYGNYDGTILVNIKKVTPGNGCPALGAQGLCTFKINSHGATLLNLELKCEGVSLVTFTPKYGVE